MGGTYKPPLLAPRHDISCVCDRTNPTPATSLICCCRHNPGWARGLLLFVSLAHIVRRPLCVLGSVLAAVPVLCGSVLAWLTMLSVALGLCAVNTEWRYSPTGHTAAA